MGKNDQLDELFAEWAEHYIKNGLDPLKFSKDGIIVEELFEKINPKVLFILRETNDFPEGDLRELYKNGPVYQMAGQLSKWASGILYNFPEFTKVDLNKDLKRTEAMKSIALMNVKKYTGVSTADYGLLHAFAKLDKSLLQREIDIIDPDIIVCCNTFIEVMWVLELDINYSNVENIFKQPYYYKEAKIIDWPHHPSDRKSHSDNYYELKKLIEDYDKEINQL